MSVGRNILIGILIFVLLTMVFGLFSNPAPLGPTVAVIPIQGPIMTTGGSGLFADAVASSTTIVRDIESAAKSADAIVLEINSPGGSAVASDEIARAVEAADVPVVAWVREAGASGAYWIASESDHIIANRMSITGSVGVIASYIEFHGLLERYNASYNRLVAGELKDAGDPFGELNEQQERFLQEKLDKIHVFFLDDVAENRNLTAQQKQTISDGRFLLGIEALELGLVDELGGREEVRNYVEELLGDEPNYVRYEEEKGLFAQLFGVKQTLIPTGLQIRS